MRFGFEVLGYGDFIGMSRLEYLDVKIYYVKIVCSEDLVFGDLRSIKDRFFLKISCYLNRRKC